MRLGVLRCGCVQAWEDLCVGMERAELVFETEALPQDVDVDLVCILWDGCGLAIDRMKQSCMEKGIPHIVLLADWASHTVLCGGGNALFL